MANGEPLTADVLNDVFGKSHIVDPEPEKNGSSEANTESTAQDDSDESSDDNQ